MYCKNCGNKCDDSAKFCNSCGTPLRSDHSVTTHKIAYGFNDNQKSCQNTPVPSAITIFIEKFKKTRTLSVVAAIMAILFIFAVVGIFAFIDYEGYFLDPDGLILDYDGYIEMERDIQLRMTKVFLVYLIFNVIVFSYFIKYAIRVSKLLDSIEINYNQSMVEDFISGLSKPIATIIMLINAAFFITLILIPLVIVQVNAAYSIKNLIKFYDMNKNSIN